jgi:hypothetical protein
VGEMRGYLQKGNFETREKLLNRFEFEQVAYQRWLLPSSLKIHAICAADCISSKWH